MKHDFDEVVDRKNSNSFKWDTTPHIEDVIPMWVADMDFKAADPIIRALEKRLRHGVFGYAHLPDAYYDAESNWWQKRHHCRIEKEWIVFSPGVIAALAAILQAFTEPGDHVLIQSPVYNSFYSTITNNGRKIMENELINDGLSYEIDFDDFEAKASDKRVKLFILCNPHNPVGKVWKKEELERLSEICLKHEVIVVADEIHRDLVFDGPPYVPFASIDSTNSITCTSPSKTFNLAGLKMANMITANEAYKKKIKQALLANGVPDPNVFGVEALIAAYNEGEEWLDQLLVYLKENRDYFVSFLRERFPGLKVIVPDSTYLMWVDCRSAGTGSEELSRRLLEEAGVRVNEGIIYGNAGEGFIRFNIGCTRAVLADGLGRFEQAIAAMK
ncbi:pyridoxal phosphate-dependent aminotransferase [Paenibacillus glycanilyticus]|uniref:MalY/PatB family protein n=1 Tax=Paenibacillus glycanilyticus TaxID=126569 RepID=UPI00203BD213|nr:MalY/PatB family protein [Paenibacillus glycanilyticus]MCM3626074.1 pyridoxal phosphate-dependent aminotransferase [Paenibacillus glycanilyticus]